MKTLFPIMMGMFLCTGIAMAAPPALHVAGTRLENPQGQVVRLQGVNVPSMEWSADGQNVVQSIGVAINDWHANVIRLPLCQDRWFGDAPEQHDNGAAYRKIVQSAVQAASDRNAYILLDLHWSDGGQWGTHIGQHEMPDDNSVLFWKDVAALYGNNPAVLFDLYNEPHDVSWDVWQHGGDVVEHNKNPVRGLSLSYQSPGMQGLLDTVRAAGAENVVVAGGLDWAYDLTGIVDGHALNDGDGHGIMYATHIYPWKKDWDAHVTVAADKYAVFVGEVGCQPAPPGAPAYQDVDPATWAPQVLAYINQHQFNWTAWSFHPQAGPCLISDWQYTPTPYWGVYVKKALAGQ